LSEIGKQANRAVAWVGVASAIIAAVDAVALALLLGFWVTPAELGIATFATTLFYFLDLVTEQGLGAMMIQRETLDEDTASTMFWLNAGIATATFLLLLGIAPLVARVQGQPIVATLLIVYGTKLFTQNIYFVPMAMLRRELKFKQLSVIRVVANFGDVGAKLGFAAAGEPIWCFVAGPLARIAITAVAVQIARPWRPRFVLKLDEARKWLTFSSKTVGTWWLTHFYSNIGYQIVGYFFGEAAAGGFRVAYELVLYPVLWISNVVQQVAFPAFARLRGDSEALAAQFIQFTRQNLTVILPILTVILVGADDILAVAFPKIGAAGGFATRLLCIVGLLRAFDSLYVPLLDGLGWAGRNLIVALVAAVVLVGIDIAMSMLAPQLGYTAVAISRCLGYPIVIGLHAYLVLDALHLPTARYLAQLGGLVACAIGAAIPGLLINLFAPLSAGPRLALESVVSLLAIGVLFAVFERITPRSILRGLRQ